MEINKLEIYNMKNGSTNLEKTLRTGLSTNYLEFSPDGAQLAYDLQTHIGLYKKNKGEAEKLTDHRMPITQISWHHDSLNLAAGGEDCLIYIWNLKKRKITSSIKGHALQISALGWQPQKFGGNLLVSGSMDGRLNFYDAEIENLSQTINFHSAGVVGVKWSPAENIVASYAMDRNLLFLDAKSFKIIKAFTHPTNVMNLVWSNSGKYLATVCKYVIRIYESSTMKLLKEIPREVMEIVNS